MSKGIEYKRLYAEQLGITAYTDSILQECKREFAKVINTPVETKHNWMVTTIITVTTLIINWAVFLLINK